MRYRAAVILLTLLPLAGCTTVSEDLGTEVDSIAKAGVSSLRKSEEKSPDGSTRAATEVVLGKSYDSFSAKLKVTREGTIDLDVRATGVSAAEGQAIAAEAVVEIRRLLAERDQSIAEDLFPVIEDLLFRLITGGAAGVVDATRAPTS